MTTYRSAQYGNMATRPAYDKSDGLNYVALDATGLFNSANGGGTTHETYLSDGSRWLLVFQYGATIAPAPPPPIIYPWVEPHPPLAMQVSEDFDGAFDIHHFFSPVGPNMTWSTANPHNGTHHLRDNPVGVGSGSEQNITANNRQMIVRFWFYLHSKPTSVNQFMFTLRGPGAFSTYITTTGHLHAQINNTNLTDLGIPSLNAWHSCDLLCDVSDPNTGVMTARYDSQPYQTLSIPVASKDWNHWALDQTANSGQTIQIDYDQIKISNDPSAFPLSD